MFRRLLILASALSLLLCVAVLACWVPSYWIGARWYHYRPSTILEIDVGFGQFSAQLISGKPNPIIADAGGFSIERRRYDGSAVAIGRPGREFRCLGVHWFQWARGFSVQTGLVLPFWLPALLTASPSLYLARLLRARRLRMSAKGLCPSCGYDLRATPSRCPECGTWFSMDRGNVL